MQSDPGSVRNISWRCPGRGEGFCTKKSQFTAVQIALTSAPSNSLDLTNGFYSML